MSIRFLQSGTLFYGMTPPKSRTAADAVASIAQRQVDRVAPLDVDGIVLYDLQDESARTTMPRPFPFTSTIDPERYAQEYLHVLAAPKIIYKSVGKFTAQSFTAWLQTHSPTIDALVLVGSPSTQSPSTLSLKEAYRIKQNQAPELPLGAVMIPERHRAKGDEHERVLQKKHHGVSFFISQCVYNVENAKQFLQAYKDKATQNNLALSPIYFTLTPCGSSKTLDFMQWLGIEVPSWIQKDLHNAKDILATSLAVCNAVASELSEFAAAQQLPIGFNIESVSIRREEIEASVELAATVKKLLLS